jgi:hypothetical protein
MQRYVSLFFAISIAIAGAVHSEVAFSGDVEIFASKNIGDLAGSHNLDVLWGLFNLKAAFTGDDDFSSVIHIRVYPAGYGFDYVKSATFDPGHNAIETSAANAAKLQVIQAWAQYTFPFLKIKAGRIPQKYTNGIYFGDYIQRGAGGSFCYPGVLHNAVQFTNTTNMFTTLFHIGVGEKHLDRGYLIVRETVKPVEEIAIDVGYYGNVFDKVMFPDSAIISNMSIGGSFAYYEKQKVYTEVGLRDISGDLATPLTIGSTFPAGGVLDLLALELEYAQERAEIEKNEVLLGFIAGRNFGSNCTIKLGMYSNGTGSKTEDLSFSALFTAAFK